MNARLPVIFGALLIAVAVLSMSIFTVDQRKYALVFQLGEIKRFETEPGLKFKLPMIQDVKYFDRRILTLDSPESELFQTAEKKNVLVDSFVRWRIKDPAVFYRAFGVEEVRANTRLEQTVNAVLREEFGKRQVHDVISGEREKLMDAVQAKAAADSVQYGVEIVDVRVKRVELPTDVSESVFRRMEAERKRVANELRSTGSAEAEQIKADADRQREVVIAEAYRDAQKIKGEGDAKAAAIYAEAFGRSPEFYRFWRSMEAYKQTFRSKSDMLVVDPSSDFFKYMKSGGGKDSGK
ncbi:MULTISPECIES: protease modulator HflC [Uliginosibacterium]|uniref:Protein HflC n=1 Tax=Uliginosibacterium aquaticum TaxID=2731212 RepID=A0ABX2IG92_9RHOO|nr:MULTISPECIES: protease modulator HflC [Uliginosibacterium]MDO6387950.1 protease modulator HflC [Uliginosibacterium sp. 31-12]NSL54012.1 protease modulator HflC [Uliginosibacterium aquaticum]PLK50078.1 protease modulator HflC [Uliginosibacterium sp. TH139]